MPRLGRLTKVLIVLSGTLALLLIGSYAIIRMLGDPGWGYQLGRVTPQIGESAIGAQSTATIAKATAGGSLFAGSLVLDWELVGENEPASEALKITTLVLDAKGNILRGAIPSTANCEESTPTPGAQRNAISCRGAVNVHVQPLVSRYCWTQPNPDLDSVTLVIDAEKRDGLPLPLRFELKAHH